MNIIHFAELGSDIRQDLQGKRWLLLTAADLPHATAALAFSELEDVLVAVDHRNASLEEGLWSRAVHLLMVDESLDPAEIRSKTGITKVVTGPEPLEMHLW
jgi:hypothetical protein